jgi:hypothetical protein
MLSSQRLENQKTWGHFFNEAFTLHPGVQAGLYEVSGAMSWLRVGFVPATYELSPRT